MRDDEFLHNFHTHTYRCKHAVGDVDDYCREAKARGMRTLGMSDHCAWPDDRWLNVRMPFEELDNYVDAVHKARTDHPELRLLLGMECEYAQVHRSYLEDELLGVRGFDYLIGGAHYFPDADESLDPEQWTGTYGGTTDAATLNAYASHVADMMRSGLFAFIAHPDLFGNCYAQWDANTIACSRDIFAAAADTGVGLEINALGLRKIAERGPEHPFPLYPWLPFWELAADYDVRVIVNADAHRPSDLQGRTGEAEAIRDRYALVAMDPATIGAGRS